MHICTVNSSHLKIIVIVNLYFPFARFNTEYFIGYAGYVICIWTLYDNAIDTAKKLEGSYEFASYLDCFMYCIQLYTEKSHFP